MVHLNDMILAQDDPFEFIYEGISATHGQEMYDYLTEMYSQVVIDYGYHPDDDFEKIIDQMLNIMEDDA
jgi:hypothetical protein